MASAASVAASYSPLSGLIGRSTPGAGAGLGGAYRPTFTNPNAPTNPGSPGAPAGVAPTINGVGAYTPDWTSLINNDAGLKDSAAALAAGGAQNQTQLDAQLANAYETFGKNVDLASLATSLGMTQADLQQALTPDVQKLATENTDAGLSTTARLSQANDKATHSIIADLNRRGILHSGEAGYQLDQQNLGFRQASSDAYQKLLGYLQQYQQGYLTAQQTNAGKLSDAYGSAADRVYTNNQSTPGVTATWSHTDAMGKPVYTGPDGSQYNADGSPYVAPNPIAAALPNYGAAVHPGEGNLYGTLDPALAGNIVNRTYGTRMVAQ